MKAMDSDFVEVLNRLGRLSTSEDYTHVCYGERTTYWTIENGNKCEFYNEYCVAASEGKKLMMAEKRGSESPVAIDLTLSFNGGDYTREDGRPNETYDDGFIYSVTHQIQQSILESVNIKDEEIELRCVVLESDYSEEEGSDIVKVHIRFQFPRCRVETRYQREVLIPLIVENLRRHHALKNVFVTPINSDWGHIVNFGDDLLMYGSIVEEDHKCMGFSCVLGRITRELLEDHDPEKGDEPEIYFIPDEHRLVRSGLMDSDIFEEDVPADYWLPLILSVDYGHWVSVQRRRAIDSTNNEEASSAIDVRRFGRGIVEEVDNVKLAEVFINMWPTTRTFSYSEWKLVGEALYDAHERDDSGLGVWEDWTVRMLDVQGEDLIDGAPPALKKLIEQPRECCRTMYKTFVLGRTTVRTLAFFMRESNPSAYKAWHRGWCRKAVEIGVSGLHYDVACAFYRLYWLEFFCHYSGKTPTWYQFYRHRLRQTPKGVAVLDCISTKFHKVYQEIRRDLLTQTRANEREDQDAEDIMNRISRLMQLLRTHGYKQSLLGELTQFFINYELDKYMDKNLETIGIANGVVVADDTGASVRPGRPEDYITKNTGIAYHKDYSYNHVQVKQVMEWFGQIFVDDELLMYFLRWASSILRGGNSDKKVPCFSGRGNNSKSMMVRFFENVFGEYSVKLMISATTSGRGDPNSPSPALARLDGARIVWLEEPEKGVPMQVSLLKQFSGFDRYYARMLKKNGGDIDPSFKPGIVCNDVPPMPTAVDDKAMKNRFCVIPCLSTWSKDAPSSLEEQKRQLTFKADLFFDKKIREMAPAGLWILISQYNSNYIPTGGIGETPEIVEKHTSEYWARNDTYYQFIEANFEYVTDQQGKPDQNSTVSTDLVYTTFKSWYRGSFPGNKVADRPTVMEALVAKWGRPQRGSWKGLKSISNNQTSNQNNNDAFSF